jgi:hypothetical protein
MMGGHRRSDWNRRPADSESNHSATHVFAQGLGGRDGPTLERLRFERGLPQRLYSDNRAEFVSAAMDRWAHTNGCPPTSAVAASLRTTLRMAVIRKPNATSTGIVADWGLNCGCVLATRRAIFTPVNRE